MRKKLLFSVTLLLIISCSAAIAQITVSGTVTSEEDGEPMPGVSVAVRGTTIGTVTDIDGTYSIEVPEEESILQFSFVGMLTQEMMVGSQRTIDVELQPDVVGLDEVVVTGYGVQRRRDITGSVASVRSQDIESMPVESVTRAIQGRLAGVQVSAGTGIPGGDVSVIVRGMGSFAANRPIWIVDGVEIQQSGLGYRSASESFLANIDFKDIESIDVLKDAAATAIYGARGAAGIIIVTTKRGEAMDRTDFSFDLSRGFTQPIALRDVMDGETWVRWSESRRAMRYGWESNSVQNFRSTGVERGWFELSPDGEIDYSTVANYDWLDAVNRTGNIMEARLTARGGDESTRFYTSLSYNNTEGHIISYDWQRYNFRLNLDHDATDRLRFDLQTMASLTDQNTTRVGGAFSSPIHGASGILPVERIYNEDGTYHGAPRQLYGAVPTHVLNSADLDHTLSSNVKTNLNFSATYDFAESLSFRTSVGLDYNHNDEEQWYDPRAGDGFAANGVLRDYITRAYSVQTTQTLNYNNVFGNNHNVSGVVGFETWKRTFRRTAARGENFPNPHMNVLSAAAIGVWHTGTETHRSRMGTFGRFNYSYDDRYMLTLTGRYDGSSRFGAQRRWGFFPAAAIGWRLSSEDFMAGFTELDNLMLRLSYGIAGTDAAGTYAALGLWSGGAVYMNDVAIYPTQLPNEYLTWEESRTLNLAISTAGFGGRINMDIDLFKRWSENLLLARPLPVSTGWSSVTENVGKTLNEGIEIALNTVNVRSDRFQWTTNFNVSFTRNEILELLPGQDRFNDRRMVGQPYGDREIRIWAGVNPADGRPMYYDRDWNITYNPVADDRHWMNSTDVPVRFGGLTNEFVFGNFATSIFFQYSGGNHRYQSDMRFFWTWSGDRNQYRRTWDDRWLEPGHVTDTPMSIHGNAYAGDVRRPTLQSSHMIQRADYLRLKEVALQYTVPSTITQRFGLRNLRIHASASNLYTWTDYWGTDPEVTGTDYGTYPQAKSITFGINTNF